MGTEITVKVCVTTVWDTIELLADPEVTTIETLKREALNRTMMSDQGIEDFQVKFLGGLVVDETRTVGESGIPDGGSLIVLPVSKTPVR